MASTKQDVVAAEAGGSDLASMGYDMEQLAADAGAGNENVTSQDVATTYWTILQDMSPQTKERNEGYIPGATAGMLMNTADLSIVDGSVGIEVINCGYERKFVEWIDRDNGGGYVGDHDIDSDIMDFCEKGEKGKLRLKSDPTHLIVETAYHYLLVKNPATGMWEMSVLALKSTALKPSRRWNKAIANTAVKVGEKTVQAPRWWYPYLLTSKLETNSVNQEYFNYNFTRLANPVSPELYTMGKNLAEMVKLGTVERKPETEIGEPVVEKGVAEARAASDDDIPF